MEAAIADATERKMEQMRAQAASQQDKAVNLLLDLVCNIRPDLHVNFIPDQKK